MKTIRARDLAWKAFPSSMVGPHIPEWAFISWDEVAALRPDSAFFGIRLLEADCRALRVAWKALAGDREGSIAGARSQNGCAPESDRPTDGPAGQQPQALETIPAALRRLAKEPELRGCLKDAQVLRRAADDCVMIEVYEARLKKLEAIARDIEALLTDPAKSPICDPDGRAITIRVDDALAVLRPLRRVLS